MRKSLFYGLLLVAGITFGMQLAETGTSRTYSPASADVSWQYSQQYRQDNLESTRAQAEREREAYWESELQEPADRTAGEAGAWPVIPELLQTPDSLLLPPPEQAPVDRFADKAANLLQQMSQRSIHWVASLFRSSEY
ncbi:hypothetical protein [Paenibacillus ihumii]|uniref:hypothetical protein n=1 Tax=Paenibacillus ihumii TaxID=687436 RepID=UPI001CA31623|nr:hypothetical protein [Paenibacillus ihumii]